MADGKTLLEQDELLAATGYKITYHPIGGCLEVFHSREDEVLIAGPAGTGKSMSCLHKVHLCMSKYPGAKAFFSRKTRKSMTDSCMATFDRHVIKPPDKVRFHKQDQHYIYPNGSIIAVVGMDDPEKIKSTDWDMGYAQEVTELTENDWEICTTRLRNWEMPYQQMISDCNPDKPTHWMKRRCDTGLTKMILSTHKDNPRLWHPYEQRWTTEGLQYLAKLQRLTGVRLKRLYQGQWVAAEGVVYENWNSDIHIVNLNDIPEGWESWTHYWTIDFGFNHPFVWQDWVEDPGTGALYRVREIYQTRTLVEDHARDIMELTSNLYIPRAIICDHDLEDRATFERHTGYLTLPAYKAIQQGVQAVQARLRLDWKEGRPGLYLVRDALVRQDRALVESGKPCCTEEEFDGYVWDEKISRLVNSKKDELPIDKDNHGMDACFIAGTLISTDRGRVPIEDVRVGDRVLTRAGLRLVLNSGETQGASSVFRVQLSNGKELIGTGNHPVWANGGWVNLNTLRYADAILPEWSLLLWSLWSPLLGLSDIDSMASSTGDIQTPSANQIVSIFERACRIVIGATVSCILTSGSIIRDLFQRGMRSITGTGTQPTIESEIFGVSQRSNIGSSTSRLPDSGRLLFGKPRHWWNAFTCKCWRQTGIGLQRVARGILSTEKLLRLLVGHLFTSAISVESLILGGGQLTSFALTSVGLNLEDEVGSITRRGSALNAEGPSPEASTPIHGSAPVHVVSITELDGLQPVYNLTVGGKEEYFANGMLVHNCRYMIAFADDLAQDPEDVEAILYSEDEVSISPY